MNFDKFRAFIFLSLLLLITIIFLYVVWPLFYPIFWAAVIASVFYPMYKSINAKIKHNNISAAITLFTVFIIFVIPLLLIGSLLIRQSTELYNALDNSRSQISTVIHNTFESIKQNPITQKLNINDQFLIQKFSDATKSFANYIFVNLKNLTQNSLIFIGLFVIMLYALFYLIRDGQKILQKMMRLCPLGDKHEVALYNKFTSAARAAIKGTLIVALIQGALGGVLFFSVGIEGALIWALIMAVFAVIPALGAWIVWFPAGIIELAVGNVWQGIIILAVGLLVVSTIDNLLRPYLIGKDTQMHPLLLLFSTLGGMIIFGITGFILGPIITALFLAFWEMYERHYHNELQKDEKR